MGQQPKFKMTRIERAKQFMPFAALKGFEEALAKQEQACDNIKQGNANRTSPDGNR